MTNKYIIQNKLKNIFSNHSLADTLEYFKSFNLNNDYIKYVEASFYKFLACQDLSKGHVIYKCNSCSHSHKCPITCKSKLCPSCGFKYSKLWTEKVYHDILDIPHRHVLFTIPKECRKFFFFNRSLLKELSDAVNDIFKYQFHNIYKKKQRKIKIPQTNKDYFTNSDIVHYGLISVIHTFGRDLKWNPHIHAIVSLGGFNKNFQFKHFDYFNINSIAGQWKFKVLNIIKNANYDNPSLKKEAIDCVKSLYKKETRFFFNVGDGNVNDPKGIIKYLGRYLARSPIAEYKITNVTDNEVSFFFNDLANNKEETTITLPANTFVDKVLIHLPPKNFKMVHRYGFYARRKSSKLKNAIIKFRKELKRNTLSFYEKNMFRINGFNPFICPRCNVRLRVWEFYHYLYPNPKRYW